MSGAALEREAAAVLASRARSFRWASWFLPASARSQAALLYAFCRLVDDTADEAPDPAQARVELERLRAELRGEAAPRPLVEAVRGLLDPRGRAAAEHLIEGACTDLEPVRVPHDEALLRYCYCVAGTVGLMMCPTLGVREPRAAAHAVHLGIAMQLTNIARDVAEDRGLGRVYLPRTRLEAAGTSPEAVLSGQAPREAVAGVVCGLLTLAERYYTSGDEGMRYIPWRSRVAILVAARVYRAIGLRLLARGGDALAGRVVVPWTGKLRWSAAALLAAVGLAWRGVGEPRPGLYSPQPGELPG